MLAVNRLSRFVVYTQIRIPKWYTHVAPWGIGACGGACYHGQLALLATHAHTHTHTFLLFQAITMQLLLRRGGALGLVLFTGCRENYEKRHIDYYSELPNEQLFHTLDTVRYRYLYSAKFREK